MSGNLNIDMTIRRARVALLAMFLTGCQSISPGWKDSVSASVDESFATSRAGKDAKAVPSDVSSALLPPIEITLPQGGNVLLEPRFDLTVNSAPARQVFMGLVEGTPYSMILHPDVSGTISLNLKEATVPEALNVIRQVYGYEYRREGNRFFILGSDMQTRMFPVNYLNLSRKGTSDTRVSASGLNSTGGTAGTTGSTSASASAQGSSGVQIQTQTDADFWKGLTTALVAIVGTEGGRKVIVNPQAGVVLVVVGLDRAFVVSADLLPGVAEVEAVGAVERLVHHQLDRIILALRLLIPELLRRQRHDFASARIGSDRVRREVAGFVASGAQLAAVEANGDRRAGVRQYVLVEPVPCVVAADDAVLRAILLDRMVDRDVLEGLLELPVDVARTERPVIHPVGGAHDDLVLVHRLEVVSDERVGRAGNAVGENSVAELA